MDTMPRQIITPTNSDRVRRRFAIRNAVPSPSSDTNSMPPNRKEFPFSIPRMKLKIVSPRNSNSGVVAGLRQITTAFDRLDST